MDKKNTFYILLLCRPIVKKTDDHPTNATMKQTPKDTKRKTVQKIDDPEEMTDDVFEPEEMTDVVFDKDVFDEELEELNDLVREYLPGKKGFPPKVEEK